MKNKVFIILSIFLFLGIANFSSAHLPRIIYNQAGDIVIKNPESSQAFYDELIDSSRNYLINSPLEFNLYINLLVPAATNQNGRYSANIYLIKDGKEEKIAFIDGQTDFVWQEYYEEFGRDYYRKGPEFEKILPAGDYKIEIFSYDNIGKYVLVVGKKEVWPIVESVKIFWILPMLKTQFFQTPVIEFLFTPFGYILVGIIVVILVIAAFMLFLGSIIDSFKNRKPKMMLLTSSGMTGSREDIIAILPKPPEDIRVAHIITASKPEENKSYVENDSRLMKEMGFNVEEVDIEGKNYSQLLSLLSNFDIIYVQGGNTFYLLDKMRRCNFKKVMKKLFRKGIIYIGISAGSIVAGKNIEPAKWGGDENIVHMSDLNFAGLNFVPFNIFVHYTSEFAEIIKKKIPNPKKRKNLKILQDGQAIFVLGKQITFVGSGEVINPQSL